MTEDRRSERLARARRELGERGMDALLLGPSADLRYLPGRFGARIEDIVTCTDQGGRRLNVTSGDLRVVPG